MLVCSVDLNLMADLTVIFQIRIFKKIIYRCNIMSSLDICFILNLLDIYFFFIIKS